MHRLAPGTLEASMAAQVHKTHLSRRRGAPDSSGNLYEPSPGGRKASVEGGWHGRRRTAQRRAFTGLLAAGAVVLVRKRIR